MYYTGYSEGVDGVNTIVAEGKIGLATSNEFAIGLARAKHPFSPWNVYQEPLVFKTKDWEESGLIAPALLIEDEKIRMRYMAETGGFNFETSSCNKEIKWRV